MENKEKKFKVLLSGGGTAGHIYPAIAIADQIRKQYPQSQFLFVGAKDKMEMQKVPQRGYQIKGLWISGLQRGKIASNLLFPLKLICSLVKAVAIIKKFSPDVVVGTGGYASAPTLKAAQWTKVPYVIQEQNSIAGITNRWVASGAEKICVAYDNMDRFFDKEKIVKTGNPVREDLICLPQKTPKERKTLLALGGSLGSLAINELMSQNLDFFKSLDIDLKWQCGKFYFEKYKKYAKEGVEVVDFIDDMAQAYANADVVISRAGASCVSELCLVGKPVIFIPSPNVAENHQSKNAKEIQKCDAAICIEEKELKDKFQGVFKDLISSPSRMETLSKNIKKLALPNSTKDIVEIVIRAIER